MSPLIEQLYTKAYWNQLTAAWVCIDKSIQKRNKKKEKNTTYIQKARP